MTVHVFTLIDRKIECHIFHNVAKIESEWDGHYKVFTLTYSDRVGFDKFIEDHIYELKVFPD